MTDLVLEIKETVDETVRVRQQRPVDVRGSTSRRGSDDGGGDEPGRLSRGSARGIGADKMDSDGRVPGGGASMNEKGRLQSAPYPPGESVISPCLTRDDRLMIETHAKRRAVESAPARTPSSPE